MPEAPQEDIRRNSMSIREERFCLACVNTGDKYKAFDLAEYQAKNQGSKAAAVSRLLKRPIIKQRIEVLQREYMLAKGVTEERILGNLAEIAFDKDNHCADRNRALELLGKKDGMWIEKHISVDDVKRLTAREREEARRIAAIRLRTG